MVRVLCALLIILLLGCTPPEVIENERESPPDKNISIRPEIPRTEHPEEEVPEPEPPPEGVFITQEPLKGTFLDVPVGEAIGEHHPFITAHEFGLLRHKAVPLTSGEAITYKETLIFDFDENSTGKIIFGRDDIDETIGTFLLFEEEKPIMQYDAHLDFGTFHEISGRDIQILGHTYVIAEVTNTSVALYGRDVESNLLFEDGKKLVVKSDKQENTIVRVEPDLISFTLFAEGEDDEGILLSKKESLSENIGHLALASQFFDITYEGGALQNVTSVEFRRTKSGYKLLVQNPLGTLDLPLAEEDNGKIILGKRENRLHITPCPIDSKFCIAPDDIVLLTSNDGRNFLLRYSDVNEEPNILFMSSDNNRYRYEFLGEPGKNAFADIIIDDVSFRAEIGPQDNVTGDYNISIQQGFYRNRAEIVTLGGYIIRILDIVNNTLPLKLIIPRQYTLNHKEEIFDINITLRDDWVITVGDVPLVEEEETLDKFGQTPFGVFVSLEDNKRSLPRRQGDELLLLIPESQAYGVVSLG